ncbi:hypothetical protein [Nocardioides litoris]|uniref:hypothetical protein n=1 Tax=Nocardioides litoris TaxID=1926648 RepID=UPI001B883996|nr:hypothetical protein [Nocardioides litoris]
MTTSPRTVADKMRVAPGCRVHVVGAPPGVVETLGLPPHRLVMDLTGAELDHVHLFVCTRAELEAGFPPLVPYVAPRGRLWVSWPRGRALGSDLGLPVVIEVGYDHAMVESTNVRVDDTWTALCFTHPKPGKVYRNSYGTLPWQRGADRLPDPVKPT